MSLELFDNASELVNSLRSDYLMTNCEIATLVGVKPLTVSRWKSGWSITSENYQKLENLNLLLAGRNINYKKEAFDILRELLK